MTAEHLMDQFGDLSPPLQVEPKLYLASPSTIVSLLQTIASDIPHVLVVAHNPGLEDLSAMLINEAPTAMPTAAIRQFNCPAWADINLPQASSGPQAISMTLSDYPKNKPD